MHALQNIGLLVGGSLGVLSGICISCTRIYALHAIPAPVPNYYKRKFFMETIVSTGLLAVIGGFVGYYSVGRCQLLFR